MKRICLCFLILFSIGYAQAQSNLLYNGNFELTTTDFYYDGVDFTNRFSLPGWEAFGVGDDSSWVSVSYDTNGQTWSLTLSGSDAFAVDFVGLAGLKTAVSNRVTITPGVHYYATVTYDNIDPAGISYFIDWFNGGGNNFSSAGGPLSDPNGQGPLDPYAQRLAIWGVAPASAVRAGVRFQSSNGDFIEATADNFVFGVQPLLSISQMGTNVVLSWTNGPTFRLQQTDSLSGTPAWVDLGPQNPRTNSIISSNAFFRLVGP